MDLPSDVQVALASDDAAQLATALLAADGVGVPTPGAVTAAALRAACILGCTECALVAARASPHPAEQVLTQDHQSFTALHHAAREGQAETLRALLHLLAEAGKLDSVDARTQDVRVSRLSHLCGGVTPLHLACASGDEMSVAALIAAKADPYAQDFNGWSAADHSKGKQKVMAVLGMQPMSALAFADYEQAVRTRNEERANALTCEVFLDLAAKAEAGDPDDFSQLLRGSDAKNLLGSMPIIQAVVSIDCPASLRILLNILRHQGKLGHDPEAAKANPVPGLNDLDGMGFSPLHCAVETGSTDCIQPLLDARADIAVRTRDASFRFGQTTTVYTEGGLTALHLAAQKSNAQAVKALLAGGAAADEQTSFGLTARDIIAEVLARVAPAEPTTAMREVAALLAVDVAQLPVKDVAMARQLVRRAAVRERLEDTEGTVQVRRKDLERIRDRYEPLDADVVSGSVSEECLRAATSLVSAGSNSGVLQPLSGVFVFPFLSEAFCKRLWDETEHYLTQATPKELPLPVRHDGCLDLSHVFPGMLERLAAKAMPAIRKLLPPELHRVSLRHAFRTKNFVGREETFARHVDKYAVTLNVCLQKTSDVKGSGVFFYDDDSTEDVAYRHEHAVGLAVLHSSKAWHQTEPLMAGERGSIIMWFSHDP